MTTDEIKAVLEAHRLWLCDEGSARADLRGANLTGAYLNDANLIGANLRGADLRGANLIGANLRGANLSDANLRGADLRGANLRGANLIGADLRGADLRGANLIGADLRGADLNGADLPNGVKWETYVAENVPQLLTIKGRAIADLRKSFRCHTWTNCPMAEAFGVESLREVPPLYRSEAQLFVALFDAGAITEELVFGAPEGDDSMTEPEARNDAWKRFAGWRNPLMSK